MHNIDLLLSCTHIQKEEVETAIDIPSIGERRICNACFTEQTILRVSTVVWNVEQEQQEKE